MTRVYYGPRGIRLTNVHTGKPVWLRPDSIVRLTQNENLCEVDHQVGNSVSAVHAKEAADDIARMVWPEQFEPEQPKQA